MIQKPQNNGTRTAAMLNGKPSKQELSTYKSAPVDNIKRQGVGVTRVGVTQADVKNTHTGNPRGKLYAPEIINKVRARIGGH